MNRIISDFSIKMKRILKGKGKIPRTCQVIVLFILLETTFFFPSPVAQKEGALALEVNQELKGGFPGKPLVEPDRSDDRVREVGIIFSYAATWATVVFLLYLIIPYLRRGPYKLATMKDL